MDSTPAEEIPGLYRAILDGVAQLEQLGRRWEAHQVRKAATSAYSAAWDAACHRRLSLLVARLERAIATPEAARSGATNLRLQVPIRMAASRRPTSSR